MRVTSQMITSNMLNNINRNRENVNIKGDRYGTLQTIQKPSDDPVVAVRTLKYRTQLTKISQYLDNVEEALSWMETTEKALTAVNELSKNIHTYSEQAVNGTLDLSDKDKILETLNEYKDQLFEMGNTDYAGRYVFTGYRTDTPLMFKDATHGKTDSDWTTYTITENLKYADITSKSYVTGGADYKAGETDPNYYAGLAPSMKSANRLQLSYGKLDDQGVESMTFTDKDGAKIVVSGNTTTQYDKDGNVVANTVNFTLKQTSLADKNPNPYEAGDNEILYVKETGELILGKNVMSTAVTHTNISAEYKKTEFDKGDIRPEHYFACTTEFYKSPGVLTETIKYTEPGVQNIKYELNANQLLTVNTLAKDSIPTTIATKIDEIIRTVNDVFSIKDKIKEAEKTLLNASDAEKEAINSYIAQLDTERVLKETILTETFGSAMTTTKEAEEITNVAVASIGARYVRGELIQSRQEEQQTTITKLHHDIFSVEIEDAVLEFQSAQDYYNASLMCASKVLENSLLDYLR